MKRPLSILFVVLVALSLAACGGADNKTDDSATDKPDNTEDENTMKKLDYSELASSLGLNIYFVCEGNRDYVIRKETITPANPNCNCYSIAKAFTVTAVGILWDQGLLSLETRVVDVLADKLPENMHPNWNEVTVHDLLLHQVGFSRGLLDIDAEDASLYHSSDYLDIVLSKKLYNKPGTVSQYTDAAYYVLSRIIERVSGQDVATLLRPILMETMDFKELAWSVCPQGYSMGATGLYLRTEDMVKLGILYINGGEWKGTRVVSKEWVDLVLENGYEFKSLGNGWYGKGGMRGQMLAFHPENGYAVAIHSYEEDSITPFLDQVLASDKFKK